MSLELYYSQHARHNTVISLYAHAPFKSFPEGGGLSVLFAERHHTLIDLYGKRQTNSYIIWRQ